MDQAIAIADKGGTVVVVGVRTVRSSGVS